MVDDFSRLFRLLAYYLLLALRRTPQQNFCRRIDAASSCLSPIAISKFRTPLTVALVARLNCRHTTIAEDFALVPSLEWPAPRSVPVAASLVVWVAMSKALLA
jgi:hypothetical protein